MFLIVLKLKISSINKNSLEAATLNVSDFIL